MVSLPPPSENARLEDHIFISYSSKDRAFVDQLASELRRLGHTVWIDFEGIRGGERWKQSIADALHPSRVVLLVLSPDSIVSEWVEEEIRTALHLEKPVIPVLLRPLPDDINSPVIQEVVKEIHYRNFTGGFQQPFERLLDDLPEPKSGIPGHCQKVVAHLASLPWGLDHYIQEEAKLLPLNASPYEEGILRHESTNLLRQLWNSKRMIILGEPGVGKSVALERLAWELASRDTPRLPILIKLLEYDGQPLLEWVRLQLVTYGGIRLQDVAETRQLLTDTPYDAYFLLDGLNEVRPQHREALIGEITRLALEFPQHQLVVTSRVQDESWRTLRQGTAIHQTVVVQLIRDDQAQRYLMAHLGAEANRLWSQLDDRMRGLARTPLLLWLIKEAWQELQDRQSTNRVRMPDNRGELYSSFVKRLLRRDDERGIGQRVDAKRRLSTLEKLALRLHSNQALTLSREEAETSIEPKTISALLANGFLVGEDELRFAPHQTLQEHFAARAVLSDVMQQARRGRFTRLITGFLSEDVLSYAADPWWAETFIQMAGLTDNPNILARAVAGENPWLALWCVREGREVDPETVETIEAQSMALVRSDDVRDRRRAAEALQQSDSLRVMAPLAHLAVDEEADIANIAFEGIQRFGEQAKWALAEAVLNKSPYSSPKNRVRIGEYLFELGLEPPLLELLVDKEDKVANLAFEKVKELGGQTKTIATDILLDSISNESPHSSPENRARGGRYLSELGDPRPGVGLRDDGLPDIQWGKFVPAGTYTIGGDSDTRWPLNKQQVTFDYRYRLARYPVTYRQFQAFAEANDYLADDWWQGLAADDGDKRVRKQNNRYANHPRKRVNWYQAVAFTRWLTARYREAGLLADDHEIRLPTEQEWEAAARYPDGRQFPWGDEYVPRHANVDDQEEGDGPHFLNQTTAVGLYEYGKQSELELHDLSGNVWEWCLNEYSNPDNTDVTGTLRRVFRGGSFRDEVNKARAASRSHYAPYSIRRSIGFRLVSAPVTSL